MLQWITFKYSFDQATNPARHFAYLVGVVDAVTVAVGDVSDSGGGRVSHSQKTGGCSSNGGSISTTVSYRGGISSNSGGGRVGKSVIADSDVGLADAGVRGVDGLGVGGHLSQVAIATQDVGLL